MQDVRVHCQKTNETAFYPSSCTSLHVSSPAEEPQQLLVLVALPQAQTLSPLIPLGPVHGFPEAACQAARSGSNSSSRLEGVMAHTWV